MKLLPSLARRNTDTEPRKLAPVMMWVPPGGLPVQCPNIHEAGLAATKFAGEKPGTTVGVYELVGTAFEPLTYPEMQPVERESKKLPPPGGMPAPEEGPVKLHDERMLENAEATLELWACTLAAHGRDRDAAEALRIANIILGFRGDFLESEKSK